MSRLSTPAHRHPPPAVRPLAGRRARWVLSREAFRSLLSSLDADEDRAAEHYEELRHKLIVFFAGRDCRDAEDQADETLDRLSRRLEEGEAVRDVGRFAYGVARLVFSESVKRDRRRRLALRLAVANPPFTPGPFDTETGVECLRHCAGRLDPSDRELILSYYESLGRERQQERRQLALQLGLTPSALRVRAYRIRRSLEVAMRECLAGRTSVGRVPGRRS